MLKVGAAIERHGSPGHTWKALSLGQQQNEAMDYALKNDSESNAAFTFSASKNETACFESGCET